MKYRPSLMGRSILGRSTDGGYNFGYLGELSRNKFVNVSIGQGVARGRTASMLGLTAGTKVLWIWGTGRYRMSSVYLAVLPLSNLDSLTAVRYFAGGETWSTEEDDAIALVPEGDVGELSARWNPVLRLWLLLFNSGNPRGILMHSARYPLGPWSNDPVLVFDPNQSGYGKFMHAPGSDQVQDNMFPPANVSNDAVVWSGCDQFPNNMTPPFPYRDGEFGGEYGPYQISRYAGIARDGAPQGSSRWLRPPQW
jgi:hypothetical protein